jgi:hypothetical protein
VTGSGAAQVESSAAVAEAVSAILASPTRNLPPALGEIDAYRAAARRIAEATISKVEKLRLTLALREDVRDAQLPEWAQRAAWEELRSVFGHREAASPPVTVEWAVRALHRLGLDECPVCRLPVLSEHDVERRAQQRAWIEEVHTSRRGAVHHPAMSETAS